MAWDGSGNFTRTNGTQTGAATWADADAAGNNITTSQHDTHDEDLADGIAACLTKNNETKPTAHFLPNVDETYNLGSLARRWLSAFLKTLKISTGGTHTATISSTNLTADRAIELPDAAGSLFALGTFTAAGDHLQATGSAAAARLPAAATVAAHATTMNPWVARTVTLSGSAVTFTDIADAAFVGQQVLLIMNAAHIWTDGAVFDVQGGETYTTAAGDQVLLVATAVDAFDVTIFPASGAAVAKPITLGTEVASTSGTSIDFTGIPAGVRRVTIMFKGVSTNGTSNLLVQIGPTSAVETTGYLGATVYAINAAAVSGSNSTSGFPITWNGASGTEVLHGSLVLSLENAAAFSWIAHGVLGQSNVAACIIVGGSKSLAAELARISITAGGDTFDAGAINIQYER